MEENKVYVVLAYIFAFVIIAFVVYYFNEYMTEKSSFYRDWTTWLSENFLKGSE